MITIIFITSILYTTLYVKWLIYQPLVNDPKFGNQYIVYR